jgi:esterase/lipase
MAPTPKLPKIILIHGLNNNLESFYPMRDFLMGLGFEVSMLRLPGHDEQRENLFSLDQAMKDFDSKISALTGAPYIIVAFSLGALLYELWERTQKAQAVKKIYLAPAFELKNKALILGLVKLFKDRFPIKSFMPRFARNRNSLLIKEYRTLFAAVDLFKEDFAVHGNAMILLDPQDELVDSRHVLRNWKNHSQIHLINRPYLKNLRGYHHMIFHEDYYSQEDWAKFQNGIKGFLGL